MSVKTGSAADGGVSDRRHADCNSCAHFFITWNKKFPFGCRAMGFMSANSPSKDVFEVEGEIAWHTKTSFHNPVRRMILSTKILEVKARNIKLT